MIRELFSIGSFSVSPFGVLLVAAFMTAYFQLRSGMRLQNIGTEDDASAILLAGGIGGILGSKIYYAALYQDWRLIFDRSGLVWYGGFFLGTAAVWFTMRRRRLPLLETLDAGTVALALGYAVGRVGCFLVGDDYGIPTDLPWGVEFPVGLPETTVANLRSLGAAVPDGLSPDTLLAVHPTQLYETAICLVIWLIGRRFLAKRPLPGSTSLLMFALLATERFGVEFLRAKDDRFLGAFTLAQLFSVLILVTVGVLAWRRRRPV